MSAAHASRLFFMARETMEPNCVNSPSSMGVISPYFLWSEIALIYSLFCFKSSRVNPAMRAVLGPLTLLVCFLNHLNSNDVHTLLDQASVNLTLTYHSLLAKRGELQPFKEQHTGRVVSFRGGSNAILMIPILFRRAFMTPKSSSSRVRFSFLFFTTQLS